MCDKRGRPSFAAVATGGPIEVGLARAGTNQALAKSMKIESREVSHEIEIESLRQFVLDLFAVEIVTIAPVPARRATNTNLSSGCRRRPARANNVKSCWRFDDIGRRPGPLRSRRDDATQTSTGLACVASTKSRLNSLKLLSVKERPHETDSPADQDYRTRRLMAHQPHHRSGYGIATLRFRRIFRLATGLHAHITAS